MRSIKRSMMARLPLRRIACSIRSEACCNGELDVLAQLGLSAITSNISSLKWWVGVEEAKPVDPVDFGQPAKELGQLVFAVEILPYQVVSWAIKTTSPDALVGQALGLVDDRLHRTAA